jgi:hypothetical protein
MKAFDVATVIASDLRFKTNNLVLTNEHLNMVRYEGDDYYESNYGNKKLYFTLIFLC